MFDRGTLVVAALVAVGVALAGFAWWFQREQTYQALEFWGHDEAAAIRAGDRLTLSRLKPLPRTPDFAPRPNLPLPVEILETVDVTKAPGLVHMRQALLENVSFDFTSPRPAADLQPTYLLNVFNAQNEVVVSAYFDFAAQRVYFAQGNRAAGLTPRLAQGLPKFFAEQFPAQ